jgi:sulfide:quinone oxidoreductase
VSDDRSDAADFHGTVGVTAARSYRERMTASNQPLRALVAGAGVAGLETILALHDLASDRVALTLLEPADSFRVRPMSVAEPFSVGHAGRYPLDDVVRRTGATHVRAGLESVDPGRRVVRTTDGQELSYDVLVLTIGAVARPAFDRALTFNPEDTDQLGGLVRDADEGYARRIAVVAPAEAHWVLPAYELALLLAREVRGMGREDVEITLVTPEEAPLGLFGHEASAAVAAELESAGVRVEVGARAELRPGRPTTVALHPSGRSFDVDRVIALPVIRPREIPGVPSGPDGFLDVDEHGRVKGVADVYAAGDGTSFPIKQGGLAAQQADVVAHHVAARAGADVETPPFVPVLRGWLLAGERNVWMRSEGGEGKVAEHSLWWPPSKVAGRWLSPYLAEIDDAAKGFTHPPGAGKEVHLRVLAHGTTPVPRDLELLSQQDPE